MASRDICIRGGGIFGLSVAWACVKAGASVVVVDPNGPGSGASGGIVGALAPHVPENWNLKKQFQFESLLLAGEFWRDVEETGGQSPGYLRSGRIQPLANDDSVALARSRCNSAKQLWQGKANWEVARSAEGWSVSSESGLYVRDTLSAHVHPRRACEALVAALRVKGVEFCQQAEPHGQPVVWATGSAGLDSLGKGHSRLVGQGIKGQAALFDADLNGLPQLFVDGLHIIPHLDGTVAVGSTTEREFVDPTGTDGLLDDVIARACAAVPDLSRASVIARWAGLRPRARTRAPMLGPRPDHPGHYIANGGFKIGFGMAPKAGQVMAQLILEGRDEIPQGFRVEDSL